MYSATGFSEADSSYTPSSGRPRCDITITFLAPALRQCSMVGIEAVMRASEVTLPSLMGTLRSARISTRLPLRSRSVNLITDMLAYSPRVLRSDRRVASCKDGALRAPASGKENLATCYLLLATCYLLLTTYLATCCTMRSMLQV